MTTSNEPSAQIRERRDWRNDKRRRTKLANVRLYPAELESLKETADRDGMTVGEVIRRALRGTRAI